MATHGEPANVSYLSHTELRIHELTSRTSPGSFVIWAVIMWKSNGNLSKESLQNLGNLSRSTRTLCRQIYYHPLLSINWYHETTAFVKTKLKLEEMEKENNAESMQKRVNERRSQRLVTFCGSPYACFVKLLEVCHELRRSAFLLPYFLWLFW